MRDREHVTTYVWTQPERFRLAGVSGAIVGARSARQVDGWLPAGTLTLSPEDLDEIAAAVERLGVGSEPVRPA